ncbi:actin [Mizuhopecten yessoensis]|uniref:Actin n=1 Tax=Mizuhopecten yessoensis TaxID=6573 RepID=A0A210PNW6_MIZYE|nr:actin [Mizuhopecten yessoensis]
MDLSTLLLDMSDDVLIQPPSDSRKSVVIDLGTRYTRVGFAGEQSPCDVFPTAEAQWHSQQGQDEYASTYPDATETVLNYIFKNKLGIDSKDHSVLIGRSLPYVHQNQEKLIEILFEKFQVHRALLPLNNAMSLFSTGQITGLVMELGAGTSYCVPIYDGYPIKGFVMSSEVTGNKLTEFFMNLLSNGGNSFTPVRDPVLAETIKENVCSVAPNLFSALSDSPNVVYKLPDGTDLSIGRERYQCAEAMFSPNLIPCVTKSIPTVLCDCITKLDSLRGRSCTTNIVKNIMLSGGGSKFTNLRERVKIEVDKCLNETYASQTLVTTPPAGIHSSWQGGSILCCHSNYNDVSISAEEYQEHGANINSLKCLF